MPTYDYQCNTCGHRFEQFQNITDAPLTKCPQTNCNGTVTRIISSGAGFLLKGSGFYATDYRSSSYKKAAESDSSSAPSADASTKKANAASSNTTTATGTAKKDS